MVSRGCCEICWDFCGKLLLFSHCRLFMVTGEMRVSYGHADVPMPEYFFHRGQINPGHHQTTREHMTEIMKRKIYDLRFPYSALER